jgi:hypothetical protein
MMWGKRAYLNELEKNGATNARKAALSSHKHVTWIKFSSIVLARMHLLMNIERELYMLDLWSGEIMVRSLRNLKDPLHLTLL